MGLFEKLKALSEESRPTKPEFIIAGLGNPGVSYEQTRHNAGFLALDAIEKKYTPTSPEHKFNAVCRRAVIGGKSCLLMRPQTFMNKSGESVSDAMDFYDIPPENIIVIYDDISLDVGTMRIRRKGSAGGHNGIRSIIQMLGTDQFLRVKIGTGAKPADMDLADYVLGRIPLSERADMAAAFDRASKAAVDLVTEPLDRVMNEYNRKIEKVPEA